MPAYMSKLACSTSGCDRPPTFEVARSGTDRFGQHCKHHAEEMVKRLNRSADRGRQ